MTYQEMFDELIHYADYDYLTKLTEEELKEVYHNLIA